MTWMDVVAPLMVIGLRGEIFYFMISSEAVRGNQWRRSRLRPRRDIAALVAKASVHCGPRTTRSRQQPPLTPAAQDVAVGPDRA